MELAITIYRKALNQTAKKLMEQAIAECEKKGREYYEYVDLSEGEYGYLQYIISYLEEQLLEKLNNIELHE